MKKQNNNKNDLDFFRKMIEDYSFFHVEKLKKQFYQELLAETNVKKKER